MRDLSNIRSSYKFSSKKHTDSFLSLGSVRIGTLYDYRKQEHVPGVSDPFEGLKHIHHHFVDTSSGMTDLDLSAITQMHFVNPEGIRHVTLENTTIHQTVSAPDCFIHCTSASSSRDVMAQFEGADSCFEIHMGQNFYARLTETLNKLVSVRFVGVHSIKYRSRHEKWGGHMGDHPAWFKEDEFADQEEVRAVWEPVIPGELKPIILNDIGLLEYCRSINPT